MNVILMMKFSVCSSYHEGTPNYDEYKAMQYVFNRLRGGMTAFSILGDMGVCFNKAFISLSS